MALQSRVSVDQQTFRMIGSMFYGIDGGGSRAPNHHPLVESRGAGGSFSLSPDGQVSVPLPPLPAAPRSLSLMEISRNDRTPAFEELSEHQRYLQAKAGCTMSEDGMDYLRLMSSRRWNEVQSPLPSLGSLSLSLFFFIHLLYFLIYSLSSSSFLSAFAYAIRRVED